MAQLCQAYTLTRIWRSSVPCYKKNFRVNFFFSDHFFWVAQMAQWFFELLSLVSLTNRCAKGYGTAWHSQISIDFTGFLKLNTILRLKIKKKSNIESNFNDKKIQRNIRTIYQKP